MSLLITPKWFTEEMINGNREKWFVFGDNEARKGVGGQAKYCRDQPNCLGIRTKRAPLDDPSVYWTDKTFQKNCRMVYQDFEVVISKLERDETVVFPKDGFGTGLALLKDNAPKTLGFIWYMYSFCEKTYITNYL